MGTLRELFKPIDMTKGDPAKNIVMFAFPMLLGNIAQQLYNTVDSIIVGRFVGDNALAAVGSAGPILNLMLVLLWEYPLVPVSWFHSITEPGSVRICPRRSVHV